MGLETRQLSFISSSDFRSDFRSPKGKRAASRVSVSCGQAPTRFFYITLESDNSDYDVLGCDRWMR